MTIDVIWCMVIAPRSEAELERVMNTGKRSRSARPGIHRARHSALISRAPGSQGSDWSLAEIISRSVGNEPVCSLWFDPEFLRSSSGANVSR
jgi:hypothetical protein